MVNNLFSGGRPLGSGQCDATLSDGSLCALLMAYRRRIAGNYRPLRPKDIDSLPAGKMIVSPKIDGELWFLISRNNEVFLASPQGKVIAGDIPILAQAQSLPDGTVIAGELYAKVDGRRARVGDLAAAMAGGKKAKTASIAFAAFDILQDSAIALGGTYDARHARLGELLKSGANLDCAPAETLHTAAQIRAKFDSMVVAGEAEGLIIRLESGLIYKLKPSITVDAAIIAYTTKSDQPGMVRSILVGLMHEDNRMQIFGACGNLGSDDDRRALMATLEMLKISSSVRYASETGSLYTFVKPEVVAEIRVTDLQSDRADGTTTRTPIVSLDKSGWVSHGIGACPRPIHPVLERLRDDKKVNASDVGFSQIDAYVPAGAATGPATEHRRVSKILRRELWTKETKGQVALRKLLVWKTNKDDIDRAYPAFVVHWTDYSASRASPLDREVRLAPDQAEAMKIADAMIAENIKKGWTKR